MKDTKKQIKPRNKEKQLKVATRDFSITYSQCPITKEDMLHHFQTILDTKLSYIAVAQEKHEDGHFHLHVQLQTVRTYELTQQRKFDYGEYHPNIQKTKDSKNWNDYVMKEDKEAVTRGEFAYINKLKGKGVDKIAKNAEEYQMVMNNDLIDLVKEGKISIYNYSQLSKTKNEILLKRTTVPAMYKRECYWVFGHSGMGKSYSVRSLFPELYSKPQSRWWDGYNNEDVVLLDDFDCKGLSHYLKIWGDNYGFNCEIKNATVRPKYTKLFITSQYLPSTLWKDEADKEIVDAIERRFRLLTVTGEFPEYQLVDYTTGEEVIFS